MSILIDGTSGITPLAFSSNLQFTSTGQRILGDFSGSNSDRVYFQSSTLNGPTSLSAMPNGTGTQSGIFFYNNSDLSNNSWVAIRAVGNTESRVQSGVTGTGSYLPMTFYTGGSERMRIDTSGNLGLGVTPFANTIGKSLDFVGGAGLFGYSNRAYLSGNAYFDGGWKYKDTNASALYGVNDTNGQHRWYVAPSGTAGNAITFTQAMTLDASGNLSLGTTSASAKLHIVGNGNPSLRIDSTGDLTAVNNYNYVPFYGSNGVSAYIGFGGAGNAFDIVNNLASGYLTFKTGGYTERMRIDSSGNVGIGTSSPSYTLDVYNASSSSGVNPVLGLKSKFNTYGQGPYMSFKIFDTNTSSDNNETARIAGLFTSGGNGAIVNGALAFYTGNGSAMPERMRIDSSGNVGIGTSSPSYKLHVASGASQLVGWFQNTDASNLSYITVRDKDGFYINIGRNSSSTAFVGYSDNLLFQQGATERMRITDAGEVYIAGTTDRGAYNLQCNGTGVWGAGAYVNGSDARLKEEVADIQSGLDVVAAMRPVTFRYKEDYSKDQSTQPGFIAQELQAAMEGKNYVDGVVQSGPEYLNVAYQNLIPILTKAIQELKSELDELKAKVQ